LIEGGNRVNAMAGIVYEPEEEISDNFDGMFTGITLHVDELHCSVIVKPETTKVKLVRGGSGKEEVLHRLQMKMLSAGDILKVRFPGGQLFWPAAENLLEYKVEK
jgi:hypothetical protein